MVYKKYRKYSIENNMNKGRVRIEKKKHIIAFTFQQLIKRETITKNYWFCLM